jgi:VanZ family protein
VRFLLVVFVLFILYGTLFPFEFDFRSHLQSPVWILIHSWPSHYNRFFVPDTITNVLLYMPLGFAAFLAFGRRWWAALLLGVALSAAVEMLQIYDATRYCSLADLAFNSVGTALGILVAVATPQRIFRYAITRANAGPAIVAACWVAHQFYPFLPVFRPAHLQASYGRFVSQSISPIETAANAAEWFALALLVEAVVGRMRLSWLALALLALPIRLFLADRTLTPAEVCGGLLALLLWAAIPERRRTVTAVCMMTAAIVLRELAPFDFDAIPQPFSWMPFADTLEADRLPAAVVLLRKAFDYGVMVWLARGIGLVRAGMVVAAALGVAEWVQRYLPGREPETTDAVLALVMTGLLVWFRRR